jgi:hypothetical protein
MQIYIIYHYKQRGIAEECSKHFEQLGQEVILAPLEFDVGSSDWQLRAQNDIKQAHIVIALLTEESVNDNWVLWRVETAESLAKPVILIGINYPLDLSSKADSLFGKKQWLIGCDAEDRERACHHILNYFRKNEFETSCFISYSHEDRDFVLRLASDLRDNGIIAWRDADSIQAGAIWDQEIEKAIKKSTHILFVATLRSTESSDVRDELDLAKAERKYIIPLLLEDCILPLRVRRAQYVDFRQGYEVALNELLLNLRNSGER